MRWRLVSLAVLICLAAGCAGQRPYVYRRATVHGIVYDATGAPLGRVRIEVKDRKSVV